MSFSGNVGIFCWLQSKYVFLVLCMLAVTAAPAQKKAGNCDYHYFKNHKVSTSQCYNDGRFGKALAYDKQGKVIYEKEIRKVAGHSSVYFSYYSSGAVQKAEWRSAPDGGIQWYSSVTTFAEDGAVTGYTEQNYDDYTHVKPVQLPPGKPYVDPPKKEVVKCAVIYSSEFWFINTTKYRLIVHADRLYSDNDFHTVSLKPGDSVKAGNLILAERFDAPEKYYRFSVDYADATRRKPPKISPVSNQQIGNELRRYYYAIR